MKILLAMSGGVDSSTLAYLLAEQGHELVGIRFTLWSDPLAPSLAEILPSKCCNAQTAARVQYVAKDLNIPLHIVDLQKDFKEHVVDPFLDGYAKGLTPNPCINCNRTIKFGKLLDLMKEYGCEALATGHYARNAKESLSDGSSRYILLEAIDSTKDQSYYLYGLQQEQLAKVMFPLGGMRKSEVFEHAKRFGVPLPAQYQESQDLCFFPEKEPQEFLKRYLGDRMKPGHIVRRDGTIVGSHKGLPLYTIGQRRGLKIGGLKVPLEVVAKDSTSNQLIVADKGSETTSSISLMDIRWVSWIPPEDESISFHFRTRSLSQKLPGTVRYSGSYGELVSDTPLPLQAAGQSAVFYRGEEVVGGGVITIEK